MNITPHAPNIPLATVVNPPTEGLRRENNQREIITQVTSPNPSAAEKGIASERERSRTPAQVNEQVDFANLRKQAEQAASSITDQENPQSDQQSDKKNQNDQSNTTENNNSESDKAVENSTQEAADARVIAQLQQRDKEVRAHELAHASTGGAVTGAPSYSFQVGPDGKKYAVGGEVSVDLSLVAGDPKATITKMQKVHSAALAPASPSSQDIKVAASATQKILAAQSELLSLNNDKDQQSSSINNDRNISASSTLSTDTESTDTESTDTESKDGNEFDSFINQTLSAQDAISSSTNKGILPQSNEVIQRAHRIESYYFSVSQGYEKPDNYQFELTA